MFVLLPTHSPDQTVDWEKNDNCHLRNLLFRANLAFYNLLFRALAKLIRITYCLSRMIDV